MFNAQIPLAIKGTQTNTYPVFHFFKIYFWIDESLYRARVSVVTSEYRRLNTASELFEGICG